MRFALLNKSTLLTDVGQLNSMAAAGVSIANEAFLLAWSRVPIDGAFYSDESGVPPDAWVITILDTSDQEGALGYHDEGPTGPDATVLVKPVLDAGGGILDGGSIDVSVASVFGHELFELLIDPFIDDWTQMADGRFLAKEVCDPVENVSIPVTLPDGTSVSMSNGVLPAYFDARAQSGPYDIAGQVSAPFQLLPKGYQIVYDPQTGQTSQVFGAKYPEWRKSAKTREMARTGRRLRRAQAAAGRGRR
jgi:hypothetical protein